MFILTNHEKRRIWHLRAILSEDNWKVIDEPPRRKIKNMWTHKLFIFNIIPYLGFWRAFFLQKGRLEIFLCTIYICEGNKKHQEDTK